jgi:hypothetical protein
MKYQKAMKKKLSRIAAYVQREVEIGKCDQSDIEAIARHIVLTVTPYNELLTPAQINAEIEMEILRLKEDPF